MWGGSLCGVHWHVGLICMWREERGEYNKDRGGNLARKRRKSSDLPSLHHKTSGAGTAPKTTDPATGVPRENAESPQIYPPFTTELAVRKLRPGTPEERQPVDAQSDRRPYPSSK